VKDAEKFADEDKHKVELIQLRNESDQLIYSVEKTLKEHGDKVGDADKKNIESAIANLRTAMNGDSIDNIKSSRDALTTASHKLAEEMYKHAQQSAGPQAGPQQPPHAEEPAEGGPKGDGAVDADFEVVDGDKK
jgi:molecular chaperone DnaK